jgi:hypothetical protein
MKVDVDNSVLIKSEVLAKILAEDMEVVHLKDDFFKVGSKKFLVLTEEEATDRARFNVIQDIFMIRSEYINKYIPKRLLALDWVNKVQALDMDYNQINNILSGSLIDKEAFIDEMISIDGLDYYVWENHSNVYTHTYLGEKYRILELQ